MCFSIVVQRAPSELLCHNKTCRPFLPTHELDASHCERCVSATPSQASHDPLLPALKRLFLTLCTVAFIVLSLLASYLGLSSIQIPQVNDKFLHLFTFFLLTLSFYWIFDSTRRRILNLTLLFVTIFLGLGSEGAQGILNSRPFDPLNIAANIIGSVCALGLCNIYHKRMLDRRRQAKGYGIVPQDGGDLEMGAQELGIVEGGAEESEHAEGRVTPGNAGAVGDDSDSPK